MLPELRMTLLVAVDWPPLPPNVSVPTVWLTPVPSTNSAMLLMAFTTTLIPEASAALAVRMSAPALIVVGPLKVLGAASVRSPLPAFVSA